MSSVCYDTSQEMAANLIESAASSGAMLATCQKVFFLIKFYLSLTFEEIIISWFFILVIISFFPILELEEHLEILVHVHQQKCELPTYIINNAARRGHLTTVQWLHANGHHITGKHESVCDPHCHVVPSNGVVR